MSVLSKTLLILGIVGLIVGLILYFQGTAVVGVVNAPVVIDKYTLSIQQGFFSDAHYCKIQVTPTSQAKPNTSYLLVIDNGIVKQSYKVSWSQLELAIHKPKTLTNKISQDDYSALGMQSAHLTAFEMRPERQVLYLVPGIVLLVAFLSYYVPLKSRGVPSKSKGVPSSSAVARPGSVMDSVPTSPQGKSWWVPPSGLPSDIPPRSANGRASYAGDGPQGELIDLQSPCGDIVTNLRIDRLCSEGKIDIREAESLRRQIEDMSLFEKYHFLWGIEHRDEDEWP
jgi:hypothetical protein